MWGGEWHRLVVVFLHELVKTALTPSSTEGGRQRLKGAVLVKLTTAGEREREREREGKGENDREEKKEWGKRKKRKRRSAYREGRKGKMEIN